MAAKNLKTPTLIVWICYLAAFLVGFTAIVGLIIAYVKKDDAAGTIYESHLQYARRTFWLGLLGVLISIVLAAIMIATVVLSVVAWLPGLAVSIWWIWRSVRGIIKVSDGKAIDNPLGYM